MTLLRDGGIGKENRWPYYGFGPKINMILQWVKLKNILKIKTLSLFVGAKPTKVCLSLFVVVHIITINSLSLRAIRLSLSVLKMQTLLQLSLNQKWNLKIKILLNTTMSYSLII